MVSAFLYWLIVPFCLAWALVAFIKRSPRPIPPDLAAWVAANPLPKKSFGAARRDAAGLRPLGVFEKLIEASDAAWRGKEAAQKEGVKASFLVFDPSGDVLEQVDS